jgi:hypothetical protein
MNTLDENLILNSLIFNYKSETIKIKKFEEKPNTIPKLTTDILVYRFNCSNQLNNIIYTLTNSQISLLDKLNNLGIYFEFGVGPEEKIKIIPSDIIFPICCVGKNRSQYLFYYFANLKKLTPNIFILGYPASADEISTIIKPKPNSVLGGFVVPYKSDGFSQAIKSSFGEEYARSIHVFDKVIRNQENYLSNELKNLEPYKYKSTSLDIYKKDSGQIKNLYLNYYLDPVKLSQLLNQNLRINYICASPESFMNLCEVINFISESNKSINLNKIRIIYFGFNDIFQRSSVNQLEINKLNDFLINKFIY